MITTESVDPVAHESAVAEFLTASEWPFHGTSTIGAAEARAIVRQADQPSGFWIIDDGERVGMVTLLDLVDIGEGAPLFDLRIAEQHRGRGVGRAATSLTVDHLFSTYRECHRIEANTRFDNAAMRRVLERVGFSHEGTLRQAWRSKHEWHDTAVYGILRTEWTGS